MLASSQSCVRLATTLRSSGNLTGAPIALRVWKGSRLLTISFYDASEDIAIGDLFDEIGFTDQTPTADDGDSFVKNEWGLEVLSLDAYYDVDGFRWTKPERQVKLIVKAIENDRVHEIVCSPEHIVLSQNGAEWERVGDLQLNSGIITVDGIARVVSVDNIDDVERLCDLQVAIAHSYFTNGILSHNSHFLTMLGANAMREGKNVIHYTLEMSESLVGLRYDSNLCEIDADEIAERKADVIARYASMKLGRLFIKEFPTCWATINNIRAHVEKLGARGFKPDLILIDYADIMRSTRQYDAKRFELQLIYQELRAYASEIDVPIWTASQSNKDGSTSEVVDLNNMAEAYGKAMEADVVVSLSRRSHEKAAGVGRLFVAKNRIGRDGMLYGVRIDTARSSITLLNDDLEGHAPHAEQGSDDEEQVRVKLRNRLRDLRNDEALKGVQA